MFKKIFNLFLLIILVLPVYAQDFTLDVKAPSMVALGDGFRVEFVMNGNPDSFEAPDFAGFEIIAGPSTSQSSSVSIINGRTETSMQYIITYVLVSNKLGNLEIKPGVASKDKKEYKSKKVLIEVVNQGSSTGASGSSSSRNSSNTSSQSEKFNKDDVLLFVNLNKKEVYKGEPIIATIELCYRVNISGIDNAKYPSFDGFWTQELKNNEKLEQGQKKINNKIYETAKLREFIIFPQSDGEITIDPASFNVMARIASPGGGRDDLFDAFFGGGVGGYKNISVAVSSKPQVVKVKPFPKPIPDSFNGAVGDFTMSAELSSDNITANGSSNLILNIKGAGNLPLINEPELNLPNTFELYKVKADEKIDVSKNGVSGMKTYTYPFIARAKGDYAIEGVEFTYFNPKTSKFKTLSSGALKINVQADNSLSGESGSQDKILTGLSKEELKIIGEDINHIIVTQPNFIAKNKFLYGSALYWIVLISIVLVAALIFIVIDKNIKASQDGVRIKSKKATRIALNRLKEAKSYMDSSNNSLFYESILRAMWGYVGDKLNMPVSNLSRDNVYDKLSGRGIDSVVIEQFINVISLGEEARYSPQAGGMMNEVYEKAINSITEIENKIGK